MLFIIAIAFGVTLTILARLPLTGWFILMVDDFSSMSIHWILEASAVLAAVSLSTCTNVAVFFPHPAMSWSISSSIGMNGRFLGSFCALPLGCFLSGLFCQVFRLLSEIAHLTVF